MAREGEREGQSFVDRLEQSSGCAIFHCSDRKLEVYDSGAIV